MAKISLKEKLNRLSKLRFEFIDLSILPTKDGEKVVVLQLADPIPLVRGSQEVELNGRKYPVKAENVTEIKIHESNINDDFIFDEDDNTGEYEGSDLFLDVSKTGQTWLVKQSYASAGGEMRAKGRNERLAKMLGLKLEQQTQAAKSTADLNPVSED